MNSFANNKLTKARIIGRAGLPPLGGIIQLLSRAEEKNSETDRSKRIERREKEVSPRVRKKRAGIGNEEKRERAAILFLFLPTPLAIRRSDKSNQLTHLPTCST